MYRLGVHLLGSPQIECENQPIRVSRRKALALLAYIAVVGENQRRDSLVNLLWPEHNQRRGRTNLRRTLYALRQSLDGDWLAVDQEEIGLNPDAEIWLDVNQFQEYLLQCGTHGHPTSQGCPDCIAPLTAAVGLYRNDFMAGFGIKDSPDFDEWQLTVAEDLRREFTQALARLVDIYRDQGVFDLAINYARRWSALNPLDEVAHCQLMQLYEQSGQRTAALQQYQTCAQILSDELGVPPQPSTTAIYESIKKGEEQAPTAPDQDALKSGKPKRPESKPPTMMLPHQASATEVGSKQVFVAREAEMEKLHAYLHSVLDGQGLPVFVTGSAGQGKTVLMGEFALRAQEIHPDLLVASGKCNAQTGTGDPYHPFREILGVLTGDVDALWAAGAITQEHARRLWDAFPLVLRALVESSPELIETLIPSDPLARRAAAYFTGGMDDQITLLAQLEKMAANKVDSPHDPYLQQIALFEQYARLMGTLADRWPLLLILDDLQWADSGSIGLFFHLGRNLKGRRILMLSAFRPDDLRLGKSGQRHPLDAVINEFRLTFGDIDIDLAQAQNQRFLDAYLDSEPNRLDAQFRETLYRQTKGHPLFTIEVLRGMQARGDLIRDEDGYWVQGKSLDWEILPTRIEAVIAERIGRLDAQHQEILRVASVEGEVFTAEVLAKVLSTNEREMVVSLSRQLEHGHRLVRAQEIQRLGARRLSRYCFQHILFQNYLYQGLDTVERAYLHEAVGLALEELYGQGTQEIALPLAHHFEEAGIVEKAITYLYQAGEYARRRSAHEAAITHLRRGLALLEKSPPTPERDQRALAFHIALGVPLVLTRGHVNPQVEVAYLQARELCERVGDNQQYFHVLLGLRRFYLHRGELKKALEFDHDLLALAKNIDDPAFFSRAYMMRAELLDSLGAFDQVLETCRQGLSTGNYQPSLSQAALFGNDTWIGCIIFEAQACWHLGYPDQARRKAEEALELARQLSHPFTLVFAQYFTALIFYLCRDIQAVFSYTQSLLETAQASGFALYLALGRILQGWAVAMQGEPERGIEQIQAGMEDWRSIGAQRMLLAFRLPQMDAYREACRIDEGLLLLAEALETVEETGERKVEAELYRLQGEMLLINGREQAEAEACFQYALQTARQQKARGWELRVATSLCRLEKQSGQPGEACRKLQEIYAWYQEGFDTPDLVEAGKLCGMLK